MDHIAAAQCTREAENHSKTLRKIEGKWVCEKCWADECGIELKESPGRSTYCPECGEVLMTRYRGGGISFKTVSTHGSNVILHCDCGYQKSIKNPFGGKIDRNRLVQQRAWGSRKKSRHSREKLIAEATQLAQKIDTPTREEPVVYPAFYHDGEKWCPLNIDTIGTYLEMIEEMKANGTAD